MIRQRVVYEWECQWCGASDTEYSDKSALVELTLHEKGCENNPENRYCYTCREMVPFRGLPVQEIAPICAVHGCASHLGNHPDGKFCPEWKLRQVPPFVFEGDYDDHVSL